MGENELIKIDDIKSRIFTVRGMQVMLDSDLAELYGVETKRLNEQVRRNIDRFPDEFSFVLSRSEYVKIGIRFSKVAFCDLRKRSRQAQKIFTESFF